MDITETTSETMPVTVEEVTVEPTQETKDAPVEIMQETSPAATEATSPAPTSSKGPKKSEKTKSAKSKANTTSPKNEDKSLQSVIESVEVQSTPESEVQSTPEPEVQSTPEPEYSVNSGIAIIMKAFKPVLAEPLIDKYVSNMIQRSPEKSITSNQSLEFVTTDSPYIFTEITNRKNRIFVNAGTSSQVAPSVKYSHLTFVKNDQLIGMIVTETASTRTETKIQKLREKLNDVPIGNMQGKKLQAEIEKLKANKPVVTAYYHVQRVNGSFPEIYSAVVKNEKTKRSKYGAPTQLFIRAATNNLQDKRVKGTVNLDRDYKPLDANTVNEIQVTAITTSVCTITKKEFEKQFEKFQKP